MIHKNSSQERSECNERSDRCGAVVSPQNVDFRSGLIKNYENLQWIPPSPITSLTLHSQLLFLYDICKQRERFDRLYSGESLIRGLPK